MRFPLTRAALLSFAVGALLGFATCTVNLTHLPDGGPVIFSCAEDSDCAGDGFKCAIKGGRGTCCKPSGAEVCDKTDNDCDGNVDNTGKPEICNGVDDDCNGVSDDGYDLKTDPNNCGACDTLCTANKFCSLGVCTARKEFDCFDGADNDDNGKTDCEDPSCEGRTCGAACLCGGLAKTEADCGDGLDNDNDSLIDCADPHCFTKSCGTGCNCASDGGATETGCDDGVDNDGDDAGMDCLDLDCIGRYCTPPALYFTCTTTLLCKCNNSVQVAEVGSVLCRDNVDNDCDGEKDCEENTCDTQPCSTDGGTGCICAGRKNKETACANLGDDDRDGLADCADSDCPQGTACLKDGGAGSCGASKLCE